MGVGFPVRTVILLALCLSLVACGHKKNSKPPKILSCDELIRSLPKDFIKGKVEVPEDYENPSGRKIQIFYYGRLGEGKNSTIVFYNGGPSSDSHSSFQQLVEITDESTENKERFPFLYIDQRGTGCSSLYPKAKRIGGFKRLANYGSKEIVLDSEIIRKKLLGDRKWKIFGQSFGGMIVKRYVEVAPEGLVSAHIHGLSTMDDQEKWLALRLESQLRVTDNFFQQYPEALVTFRNAEEALDGKFCVGHKGDRICGKSMIYGVINYLGFSDYWSAAAEIIDAFMIGKQLNKSWIKRYIKEYVLEEDGETEATEWAGFVINYVDSGITALDLNTCKKLAEKIREKSGRDLYTEPLHECKGTLVENDEYGFSAENVISKYLSNVKQNVQTLTVWKNAVFANPSIPIYLYSGEKDSFVPVESFAEEVEALKDVIHYHNFPDSGHEGFLSEGLVWENLLKD